MRHVHFIQMPLLFISLITPPPTCSYHSVPGHVATNNYKWVTGGAAIPVV